MLDVVEERRWLASCNLRVGTTTRETTNSDKQRFPICPRGLETFSSPAAHDRPCPCNLDRLISCVDVAKEATSYLLPGRPSRIYSSRQTGQCRSCHPWSLSDPFNTILPACARRAEVGMTPQSEPIPGRSWQSKILAPCPSFRVL